MKHLIIYAHPSKRSFSFQLKNALKVESERRGWSATIRDLYEMKFDPVLWPSDLEKMKTGNTEDYILKEQELVKEADIISVVYPLWWAGFPAILKGYIDKILSYGFAYKAGKNGIEGLLTNKKVYLYTSMGNKVEEYEEKGLIEAFRKIQGGEIFEFCGMNVEHQQFFPQIPSASTEEIEKHLQVALSVFEPISENVSS
ncbi:NAD(P)H-dependent oxidoreductase [Carboxylicivirga linearis]|uniref:NAD(P)H-dependent oxidoreductase n=1 Tax=Carboxylicivirga linearis TaxID=1628157 RepID=A0ABS5JSV6_9BACT|nr:NAD(P)H-dependent oxidoreductase [Carboxylicivirga linearis]MBS2097546.1 NAD(P)H-dependent oxidoreductase [Carboxylicivirga linearis]